MYRPHWLYLFLMWCLGLHWREEAIAYYLFRGCALGYAKYIAEDLTPEEFAELLEYMTAEEWIAYVKSDHFKNVQLW